jgi:hypothetical protein
VLVGVPAGDRLDDGSAGGGVTVAADPIGDGTAAAAAAAAVVVAEAEAEAAESVLGAAVFFTSCVGTRGPPLPLPFPPATGAPATTPAAVGEGVAVADGAAAPARVADAAVVGGAATPVSRHRFAITSARLSLS